MKKLILIAILAVSSAANSFAQRYEIEEPIRPRYGMDVNRLRLGAFFAPNITWMKATATKSDDRIYRIKSGGSKVGFTWGLLADYYFSPNYAIATGFQVNTVGGKITSDRIETDTLINTVDFADFSYTLQYFEVPFNLKLKSDYMPDPGLSFFGQIGLTAGINIGKKATYLVNYFDENQKYLTVTGDKEKLVGSFTIAPVELQFNIGGGIEKPISEKMSAYFGIFFNNTFLPDVTNPGEYDPDYLGYKGTFSDGNIRLNSLAFRFGLFF
jgi:hypothetical protein